MATKKLRPKHRLDWRPDLPDQRDFSYAAQAPEAPPSALPRSVDLRPLCSPIVNQGKVGSCTGNALAGLFEFLELKELRAGAKPDAGDPEVFTAKKFAPASRLFIYYNERDLEGRATEDSGASLRDGIRVLAKIGACRESVWKYTGTNVLKKPTPAAYKEAASHKITTYLTLSSLAEHKQCLAAGYPVAFGLSVYESFESPEVARTGLAPMPGGTERLLGGHAVLAVGYDDIKRMLLVRNSWGTDWGLNGYFWLPYGYLEARLCQDFWTARK